MKTTPHLLYCRDVTVLDIVSIWQSYGTIHLWWAVHNILLLFVLVFGKKKLDEKAFLTDDKNLMVEMQVHIQAVAKNSLNKANVAICKTDQFRKDCGTSVICMLLKLHDWLLTDKFNVIQASSLSPTNMVKIPVKLNKRFTGLEDSFYSLNIISAFVADNAKFQFSRCLETEVVNDRKKFKEFDFRTHWLDSFLYPRLGTCILTLKKLFKLSASWSSLHREGLQHQQKSFWCQDGGWILDCTAT